MLAGSGKAPGAVGIPRRLTGACVSLVLAGGALMCAYLLAMLSERKSVETNTAAPAAETVLRAESVSSLAAVQTIEVVRQTKTAALTRAAPPTQADPIIEADAVTETNSVTEADPDIDAVPLPRVRPDRVAAGSVRDRSHAASAETGLASYYQPETLACGGPVAPQALTAAHRSLPCGTVVKVTNTKNGRYAMVQINDRGPFIRGRVIDVSRTAAHDLDMIGSGVVPVRVEVMP